MSRQLLLLVLIFTAGIGCNTAEKQASITKLDKTALMHLIETEPDLVIVDVRTAAEVANGAIPHSVNYDWRQQDTFEKKVGEIDKSTPVVVYCLSGTRSAAAAAYLYDQGFNTVYDFTDGYSAWND